MSTTLLAAMQELSRQLGDSWQGATTGAGSATTLVDAALMGKPNDWITDNSWSFLTQEPAGAAAIYDERKISSLDNTTGTLTTLAFAAAPGTGINYEVHRLFSPSEKRTALISAAKRIFPDVFNEIWNEELVSGNWLNDGSLERWTNATTLSQWTTTGVTATQTSANGLFKHGSFSAKLSGSAGNIKQSIANFDDLKRLQGKNVTFTMQIKSDTASSLRIAIYDGTTTTYSAYHSGNSAWTQDDPRNDNLQVTAQIGYNPTIITFYVYKDVAAGDAYVDDGRVMSGERAKLYIGHLGLGQNQPSQVSIEPSYYSQREDWLRLSGWKIDNAGFLYLPTSCNNDRRLRVRGIGYLDFLASGVSSTAWTSTINLDTPQLDILVAEAALYLYTQMALPNFESGTRQDYQAAMKFWQQARAVAVSRFGMVAPPATINWGVH